MTSKRWTLVVTELGSSTPLRQTSVGAPNWMAAIKDGRAQLGEPAAVPSGSSCQVAPDGKVTVHAPLERQSYLLYPEGSAAAAELSRAPAPPPPAAAPAPRRARAQTMAYIPDTPLAPPPQAAPAKPARPKTMAYIPTSSLPGAASATPEPAPRPSPQAPPAPPGRPVAPAAPLPPAPAAARQPAPPAAAPAPAPTRLSLGGDADTDLFFFRDEEPTEEVPLHFHERGYAVDPGTSEAAAERVARNALRGLEAELADEAKGHLVRVSVYDHTFEDEPAVPAIVTLDWKDWRNELTVYYPLAAHSSRVRMPRALAEGRDAGDAAARRARADESFPDLSFARTAEEAVVFATRLVEELVGPRIIRGCLVDRARGALVVCAERGVAGTVGVALPAKVGLCGIATASLDRATRVAAPLHDPRFDPRVDAVESSDPTSLVYVPIAYRGELVGLLQLLHDAPGAQFTTDDEAVALHVAQHVGSLVHALRGQAA